MRIRLYLDEDVNIILASVLRAAGYDCISAHEVAATGIDDEGQLILATDAGRTIFTYNAVDFRRIATEAALAGRQHAGIIVSYHQYTNDQVGRLSRGLISFLEPYEDDALRNACVTLPRVR